MKTAMKSVAQFHKAFGHPIATTPGLPSDRRRTLRMDLLEEEYNEYLAAERQDDLIEIADALGDMVVIICGTCHEYGIPLADVFAEIMRANMSKLGADGKPIYRTDGKVMKGANYSPPRIAEIVFPEKGEAA